MGFTINNYFIRFLLLILLNEIVFNPVILQAVVIFAPSGVDATKFITNLIKNQYTNSIYESRILLLLCQLLAKTIWFHSDCTLFNYSIVMINAKVLDYVLQRIC